ncbi:MAG: AraC family transcriptional regulator [Clostridiales Family XIII bacterium]|jgi:AraC-like DNA-binding protein/ligand-binding sensor protein|nr:AraC family transcriptional regulator [Clostridiales Family XIII bacterium]
MKFSTLEDFSTITGVGVSAMNINGEVFYASSAYERCRSALSHMSKLFDNEELCRVSAVYNSYRAKRFGGRFIFYCPRGFVFFVSPLIRGGRSDVSILGGPVLISDYDDYIEFDVAKKVDSFDRKKLLKILSCIPVVNVRTVTALSEQLFVNALHLSDSDYMLSTDAEASLRLKEYMRSVGGVSDRDDDYQTKQEQKLIKALAQHDEYPARALLNSIIGHILFHSGKNLELVRNKMLEFTVLLLQTAIRKPGVDMDYIFGRDCAALSEIDNLETLDNIVDWLNDLISRFSECIFNNDNHSDVIFKTISFMKSHYRHEISLEEMARAAYISPSYLSKVFKQETGYTINNYLSKIRIDESKKLMADKSLSLLTICGMVGFEDQSYFSKVFKKQEGVSPAQYRKRFANNLIAVMQGRSIS